MLAGLKFARRRAPRCALEALARADSKRLKVEIEQRVVPVPHRRMLLGRDDAPPSLRLDKLRQLQHPIYCSMACCVFYICPVGGAPAAMLTPPVARFKLEWGLAGRELL